MGFFAEIQIVGLQKKKKKKTSIWIKSEWETQSSVKTKTLPKIPVISFIN